MNSHDIPIRNVMTPTPITIGPAQKLTAARKLMRQHNIRHLPVLEAGKVSGVLSERDIYFLQAGEGEDQDSLTVGDALTDMPYIVSPETGVAEVARRMGRDRIGSALVVDNGKCVGIFTAVDACYVLAEELNRQTEQ